MQLQLVMLCSRPFRIVLWYGRASAWMLMNSTIISQIMLFPGMSTTSLSLGTKPRLWSAARKMSSMSSWSIACSLRSIMKLWRWEIAKTTLGTFFKLTCRGVLSILHLDTMAAKNCMHHSVGCFLCATKRCDQMLWSNVGIVTNGIKANWQLVNYLLQCCPLICCKIIGATRCCNTHFKKLTFTVAGSLDIDTIVLVVSWKVRSNITCLWNPGHSDTTQPSINTSNTSMKDAKWWNRL